MDNVQYYHNEINYKEILNIIIIFSKLYIQSFESCSQSYSIVIKANNNDDSNLPSYNFLIDYLMSKGKHIPPSHTQPYKKIHNNTKKTT